MRFNLSLLYSTILTVLFSSMSIVNAVAALIDFDSLQHGEIANAQFAGVSISADNVGGGPDLAIIFDSRERSTEDTDLEGPGGVPDKTWSGGNLPNATVLGNMLIIAENDKDTDPADGFIDKPDDEGSRPAGSIYFDFDIPIQPITAADLSDFVGNPGLTKFDHVEINFGGSAAVDNIRSNPVPEPATMLMVGSGLIILAGIGRKKFLKKKGPKRS
jgi:hypothetical protein